MPSSFPRITFCNNNPFQTKFAVEYLRETARENDIDISPFFDKNKTNNIDYLSKLNSSDYLYELAIIKMNSLNNTIQKQLSHKLTDLLISCKFNNENCTEEDFSWSFHRYRGI
jgi:hypothetical protein